MTHVNTDPTFEIWAEGYVDFDNHEHIRHFFIDHGRGTTFKEACDWLARQDSDFKERYDSESMTYEGRRLFDNREDAMKNFG